jgi:hypothetical protein
LVRRRPLGKKKALGDFLAIIPSFTLRVPLRGNGELFGGIKALRFSLFCVELRRRKSREKQNQNNLATQS